ncbi:MAG: hypothetical protein ABEI07_01950 [Candidatus Nanohaloarchaea archaeon]
MHPEHYRNAFSQGLHRRGDYRLESIESPGTEFAFGVYSGDIPDILARVYLEEEGETPDLDLTETAAELGMEEDIREAYENAKRIAEI